MNNKNKIILISIIVVIALAGIVLFGILGNKENNIKTYKVTFDSGNGEVIEQNVNEGETVQIPEEPTKEGYIFVGWMHNGYIFDFSKGINNDINLEAEWKEVKKEVENFVVKFDTDGGTTIANQVLEKGEKVSKPTTPIKEGHIFKYWMLNDKEYDFNKEVTENITLKAIWEKVVLPITNNQNNNTNNNTNNNGTNKEENIKVATPTLTNASGAVGVQIEANLHVISDGAYSTEASWNTVSGWELYEKVGTNYNLVESQPVLNNIKVTVDAGESKIYVARAYKLNKNGVKIYSGYSNEVVVDNSKVATPTLTNASGTVGVQIEANLHVKSDGVYSTEASWNTVSGWELYEKIGTNYNLVESQPVLNNIKVTVDAGESKIYVARAYKLNKNGVKIYSGYSNEVVVDNSKVATPTLTNASGVVGVQIEANLHIKSDGAYSTEASWNTVSGWELYEKVGTNYNLVESQPVLNNIKVTVDAGESKIYVARAYKLNKNGVKIYSGYSNELVLVAPTNN